MGDGRADWECLDVLPNLVGRNQGEGLVTIGRKVTCGVGESAITGRRSGGLVL